MEIKIWGTRGSTPVSGAEFSHYGGETSCIEVLNAAGESLILDAGTGLWAMERAARKNGKVKEATTICLTHTHLDHIQGLPFYSGLYTGKTLIYGPKGTEAQLNRLFDGVFHPVRRDSLKGVEVREIDAGAHFSIGSIRIETAATNHPGHSLAYKLCVDDSTFVYGGDHEIPLDADPEAEHITASLLNFMDGADIALVDAHFSESDHRQHKGWGHSHPEQWAKALQHRNVGQIIYGHFSPSYTDIDVDKLLRDARSAYPRLNLAPAFGGCSIKHGEIVGDPASETCPACEFFKKTAPLSDTHAVLDSILTEARKVGHADAGSVYLAKDGNLSFSAAQNDTLFPASAANKFFYMNSSIPISKASIAGYVAATGVSLNIADVYELPQDSEYGFNVDFDKKSGYRTKSILAVPLLNARGEVTGVLQLINSLENGKVVPFTQRMEKTVSNLAAMATVPLERSFLLTSMILRMLQTSALRDPSETAGHVYRVGAMAAELYHRWAEAHDVEPGELLATKGVLRMAAMLHDVGKVGIPDAVLKKPGRLTDEERAIMQKHAILGSSLFKNASDGIDRMAGEIALHHHAKWDGSGYTGDESIPSPAGRDIPLWARITAIADVYDALVSRRCYKEAWDSEKAMEVLRKEAGSHFDPELVEFFGDIQDTVKAIIERYQ